MHGCFHKTLHCPKRSTTCKQCESLKADWQVQWWLHRMDDYLPKGALKNCNKFKPMWKGAVAILTPWQAQTLPLRPLDQHSQSDIWPQMSQPNLGTWQKANLLQELTSFFAVLAFFPRLVSSISSPWNWMNISTEEEGIQQDWFWWLEFATDPIQKGQASHTNKGDLSMRRYQANSPEKQNRKTILDTVHSKSSYRP